MGKHGKYRPLVTLAAALALWAGAATAQEACRQALALGLDVSGSVNSQEYRLQLDGLAGALTDPDVAAVLLSMPGAPVRLLVYEWSGSGDQNVVVGWTTITDAATLAGFAEALRRTSRQPSNPATALGTALVRGAEYLADQSACWKRTLDISGDGKSNTGPRPQDVSDHPALADIVVNALVIGSEHPDGGVAADGIQELQTYYKNLVIRGAGAFVETATDFNDYERAMVRKLLRELEGMALSSL